VRPVNREMELLLGHLDAQRQRARHPDGLSENLAGPCPPGGTVWVDQASRRSDEHYWFLRRRG
jgi:hypothetical protein